MRIQESSAKFIFCDSSSVAQCTAAANKVSWDVQIIVFGQSTEHTSIQELYEYDGKGKISYRKSLCTIL